MIGKSLKSIARYVHSQSLEPGEARFPREINLPITDNCNARCVMCDVYKTPSTGELTSQELRRILENRLFAEVRHVGISGGEPSLRKDLPELLWATADSLPRIETLSITSHGFHTQRWRQWFDELLRLQKAFDLRLTLNLSLDGRGEVHDRVRGIPRAFEKTTATLKAAREAGIAVRAQCTVSAANVYGVPDLIDWAGEERLDLTLRVATEIARLDNVESVAHVRLSEKQASFFRDLLESTAAARATRSVPRRLFYKDLAPRLTHSRPRAAPCAYQNEAMLLTAHGELYPCSISQRSFGNAREAEPESLYFSSKAQEIRKELVESVCPGCLHDQSGAWSPLALAREATNRTEIGQVAQKVGRALRVAGRVVLPVLAAGRRPHQMAVGTRDWKNAVCVGAYGGEHVGDAAILGGVLLRLHQRYGVKSALIVSSRPHRTRRWIESLHVPVRMEVVENSLSRRRDVVSRADVVVHAGGPLMDLPELLVEHLETLQISKTERVPFVFEGIGVGPFRLMPSQFIASELLAAASQVSVRSSDAANHPALRGRAVPVEQDPAFDYLATRTKEAFSVPLDERTGMEELFQDTQGKRIVAINLRPLWSKYGGRSQTQVEEVERQVLKTLSEALLRISEEIPVCAIFFPMNADQYGFSDLTVAAKLGRYVHDVDYRVWKGEPGIDAVLTFLSRADAVIAMRFHACIFALSRGCPTLGIDYSLDGVGKVGRLMQERGLSDSFMSVATMDPNRLVTHLRRLLRE